MLAGLSIKLYFSEAILFPVVENQWILLNGYSLISYCFFLEIVIMLVAQSYLTFFFPRLDFSLTSICWVLLCAKYISRCCGYRRVSVLSSLPTFGPTCPVIPPITGQGVTLLRQSQCLGWSTAWCGLILNPKPKKTATKVSWDSVLILMHLNGDRPKEWSYKNKAAGFLAICPPRAELRASGASDKRPDPALTNHIFLSLSERWHLGEKRLASQQSNSLKKENRAGETGTY